MTDLALDLGLGGLQHHCFPQILKKTKRWIGYLILALAGMNI